MQLLPLLIATRLTSSPLAPDWPRPRPRLAAAAAAAAVVTRL